MFQSDVQSERYRLDDARRRVRIHFIEHAILGRLPHRTDGKRQIVHLQLQVVDPRIHPVSTQSSLEPFQHRGTQRLRPIRKIKSPKVANQHRGIRVSAVLRKDENRCRNVEIHFPLLFLLILSFPCVEDGGGEFVGYLSILVRCRGVRGRGGGFRRGGVIELRFGSGGAQRREQHRRHALVGIEKQILVPARALVKRGVAHVPHRVPGAVVPPRRRLLVQFEKLLHREQ
mmetsp:Transcript_4276/g.8220  ORF Transcript_4276/g.8220 Transcript_4276/m.8220 type:complete len:229 (+) Transcript_4276:7606-8292(+)